MYRRDRRLPRELVALQAKTDAPGSIWDFRNVRRVRAYVDVVIGSI